MHFLFRKMSWAVGVNLVIAGFFFSQGTQPGVAVLSGALLSSIFVLSSTWILDHFSEADSRVFLKAFFISLGVRFLLVLLIFGFLIGTTKIDEIYFTVSFIISYLYQSVTEMIFLNQILQKSDTRKK